MSNIEYRAVMKFLVKEGIRPSEIFERLRNVYGDLSPSYSTVKYWCSLFKMGRESLEDNSRPGRPVEATTPDIINRIEDLVLNDGRLKKKQIARMVGVSETTVLNILHTHLGMSKVSARWVPRNLSSAQRKVRIDCCKEFLSLCGSNPMNLLTRIVTGDETWVHHYDPESKQESMQWRRKGDKPPVKFKVTPSAGKIMATIFWDSEGILLIDYKDKGETITGEYYCNVLTRLRESIKEKRRGKLSRGIMLLHDNAPVHTSRKVMATLDTLGFDLIGHPPYSPDLAPSDYFLFPNLKKDLRGRRFVDDIELKQAIDAHFESKEENYYLGGLEKLINRCNKCIKNKGHYIEK